MGEDPKKIKERHHFKNIAQLLARIKYLENTTIERRQLLLMYKYQRLKEREKMRCIALIIKEFDEVAKVKELI